MKKIISILAIICCLNAYAQVITTIAGNGTGGYSGDGGQATNGELYNPSGVATDASGNIYIADYLNNRIRKININGYISTIAGTGTAGYSGDGGTAGSAQLNKPTGVCIDGLGNIYIADYNNNRVRKVTATGIITTIAGNGTAGFSGDGAAATNAELNAPYGVYYNGDVYIADQYNNRIRVITSGVISTVAGNGTAGYSGDGGLAINAELNKPTGVFTDHSGHLCIVDMANSRIRMISNNYISTIIGTGIAGYSGDGGIPTSAQLYAPYGACTDALGNIYIADYYNQRIRMVNTGGIISTIAGDGTAGFSGDGTAATNSELNAPYGICSDASGNIYIADKLNNRIRKINSLPNAGFSIPSSGCMDESTGFTNTSLNSTSYVWSFGDGGTSTGTSPSYVYATAGTYTVKLIASNMSGSDSAIHSIIIYPLTTTINASSSTTFCEGDSVILTSSATKGNLWYKNSITISDTAQSIIVKTSGLYTVKDNNNTCAPISVTTTITVNALPTVTATSNTTSLCIDSTATLQANGASTYTWSTGVTSPTIAITPTNNTTYTVIGTDVNGCVNKDTITQVVINCTETTGINRLSNNNSINIYPNPTTGIFIIETNSPEQQTLHIYDVNGKLVLIQSINGRTDIDASSLNEGVYNISIISNEGVVNRRLIIVK